MTVAELCAHLQTQPQDLPVVYRCYSEFCLVVIGDIEIGEACVPRPDGWVHAKRPDKPTQTYLILP